MKIEFLIFLLFFIATNSFAHNEQLDEIVTIVEESPSFPGGEKARLDFLSENLHYPEDAFDQRIQGPFMLLLLWAKTVYVALETW